MPIVPTVTGPQVKQDALRPVQQSQIDVSSGATALARGIGDVGEAVDRIALRDSQAKAYEVEAGVKTDFLRWDTENRPKFRGANVGGYEPAAQAWWKERSALDGKNLDARTRTLVGPSLMQAQTAALANVIAFTGAEKERHTDEVTATNLTSTVDFAIKSGDTAGGVTTIKDVVAMTGIRKGWAPEQIKNEQGKYLSALHLGYIGTLADNNPAAAHAYYTANEGDINSAQQPRAKSIIQGGAYNLASAGLESMAQAGDVSGLQAARARLEGAEGEIIDPARRMSLITKTHAFEQGIAATGIREAEKAKREAEARENKAGDVFKTYQALVVDGRFLSVESLNELSTVTAGTSYAPAVQELVKAQAQVAGFAALPMAQQTAQIEQLRAAGSTRAIGTSPDQERLIAQLERTRDAGQKAYAENPWTAAQERGVIKHAPEANMNDMQSAQAMLTDRMKQIHTVEAAAGRKVSPFQPQEAEQFGRIVQMLPPDQQSTALASISTMVADGDRLTALARQIDAKDKVLGTAMMVGDLRTSQGRYVSELVLKGSRAIKDKAITMDDAKETGWRGSIANEIGEAFPNQEQRNRVIEAAYLAQAGMAAEGGGTDTSRAIRLVAGRIIEHNGSKIPLPRAMEESDFEKRISSITPEALAAQTPGGTVFVGKTAVPVADFVKSLPDYALVHAGQGRYNVRAGMGLVVNAQGKRITIEVRNGN